jgi:hypothetical protein
LRGRMAASIRRPARTPSPRKTLISPLRSRQRSRLRRLSRRNQRSDHASRSRTDASVCPSPVCPRVFALSTDDPRSPLRYESSD